MKYIRYIGIFLAVIGMIYTKNQIDIRNKSDIKTIDSLDQDEGTTPAATKKRP
jgi:hypothetical protein